MHRMIFKYEEMLRLREAKTVVPPTEALRRLSAEFPGALRELDRLSVNEIERRLTELRGGAPGPLLVAIARYHERLREALTHKQVVPGQRLSRSVLVLVAAEMNVEARLLREALGLRGV